MFEAVHRVVSPVLWGWVGREEPHLFAIGLTQQAGVVMNLNSDVLEEGNLPAWLYEVSWTGGLIVWW